MGEKDDLGKYVNAALDMGATGARVVDPGSVVTAPWVRWKCRYGCENFGRSHCCPPSTPADEETRRVLDAYRRAILLHHESPSEPGRGKRFREYSKRLVELEDTLFKDGYYKALVLLSGPCLLCPECAKKKDDPCRFGDRARPSMESCGIDVFATARNNGFPIETLREKDELRNLFCLLLVD